MIPRAHRCRGVLLAYASIVTLASGWSLPARASDLKRGDPAPAIESTTIDGRAIDTAAVRDTVQIVLFGDLSQERTLDAARRIANVIADPRDADSRPQWITVLANDDGAGRFVESIPAGSPAPLIIRDDARKVFGAYHVVVLPTTFVIAPDHRMALVMPGLTTRFGDMLRDGIDLAQGRLTAEEFDRRSARGGEAQPNEARLRAERLTRLAQHLIQRDMAPMAEDRLREASEADPTCIAPRLLLARLMMDQGKPDDAESQFRKILELRPRDDDATLGLVEVHIRRGGPALATAAEQLAPLLALRPDWPRARYVSGLLREAQGEGAEAAAEFKRAAELLLREIETNSQIEGSQSSAPDEDRPSDSK